MKLLAIALLVAALLAGAFGYWGPYTVSGRRRFDEMAGMVPLLALVIAGLLLLGAVWAWVVARAR